jgi:flagellar biosynthetic protein FlhB
LLLALLCLAISGGGLAGFLEACSRYHLGGEAWLSADVNFVVGRWNETLLELARVLLPIFGLLFFGAIAINLMQIGFLFLPDKVAPDISRLSPIKGLQRLFSLVNAVKLGFGVFKILIIAGVALVSLYYQADEILNMTNGDVREIGGYMLGIMFRTAMTIAVVLLILALLDYAFQRWKHEQDIKMTPQEIREEMKHLEGSPEVIARRRQVQRQLALNRLGDVVPKADVVVTNPTELAVAIQYKPETMAAPIVVAKGAGVIAQRIRRLALEHGIPIIEKKPLARALYCDVEINHAIPEDKYAAVAELLAYVYQLQGKQIPGPPQNAV